MLRHIAGHMAQAVLLLISVVVLIFCLLQLIPGDPIQAMVGDMPVPPALRASLEQRFQLNEPFLQRLYGYLVNVLHGDLGYSMNYRRPVFDILAERFPRTLLLAGIGYAFGIADRHRDRHSIRGHAASQRRPGMVEPRADRLRDADLLGWPAARHGVLDPSRMAADARHGADDLARLGRRLAARAGDLSGAAGRDLHHPGNHPRGTLHACQRVGRRSSRDTSSRRGRKACRGARSSWGTWFAIRSCRSSR